MWFLTPKFGAMMDYWCYIEEQTKETRLTRYICWCLHLKDSVKCIQLYWLEMTILFLCKQVKHGIIYWLYEETCVFFIFAVSMKTCLKNYKLRRIRDEKVAKQRKTEKKNRNKSKLVCLCLWWGVILFYINKKNKDCVMEICLFLWQRCSHDNCCSGWHRRRHTQKSESSKDAYKMNTCTHVRSLCSLTLRFFTKRYFSVPLQPSSLLLLCLFLLF